MSVQFVRRTRVRVDCSGSCAKNLHSIGVHLGPDVELVVLEVGADLLEEPLRLGLEVLDLLVRGAPRLELRGQVLEVAYKWGGGYVSRRVDIGRGGRGTYPSDTRRSSSCRSWWASG